MMKPFGRLGLSLALGLALALSAQTAKAGNLQIDLNIAGFAGGTISIFAGSGFETPNSNPADDPTLLSVNTSALNDYLKLFGLTNVTFNSLSASSNNPGAADQAFITQNGNVTLTAGSGSVSFSVLAYNTGFTAPTGNAGVLNSSSSATFTNVGTSSGDSATFQSWYNPNNDDSTAAPSVPSPSLAFLASSQTKNPFSFSGDAAPTNVGLVTSPYSLLNQSDVTITAAAGKPAPTIIFGGSTVLTVIPEPASVVMTMSALPIVFSLIRRYRRGAKTPA